MASPASSPRLPSPPPIAEDQLGPKSPVVAPSSHFNSLEHAAARRIRPGTKAEDMAEGPPLVDLSEIDSAFQLTEHLKALHNSLTHPVGTKSTVPVDKEMAHKLAQPPENVDKTLWLYELCRFLTQKVNAIIVALFSDNPPCSSITCPEMRASEWQYLCAVHDPPKSCCAIDYCCHTLDWAANTLTSPKHFPSRLALGVDQATQHQQIRQLTNIFRRVYRIFAHAWFQHREMFWKVEGQTGLYTLFKTVCDVYGLIPEDNYTIPAEAEGIEPTAEGTSAIPPLILKREPSGPGAQESESSVLGVDHNLNTAGTTKRHRHSPSVGATSVLTVMEENEEEEDPQQERSGTEVDQTAEESTPVEAKPDAEVEPAAEESVSAGPSAAPEASNEAEKQSASEDAKEEPESAPTPAPDQVAEAKNGQEENDQVKEAADPADAAPVSETKEAEDDKPVDSSESQEEPKKDEEESAPAANDDKDDKPSAPPVEQQEAPEKAEKEDTNEADIGDEGSDKDKAAIASEDKKTGE